MPGRGKRAPGGHDPPPLTLRFAPPAVPRSPALDWVLRRAFGPPSGAADPGADPGAAVALARRLSLAPRIAARSGRDELRKELGEAAAALLARLHREAVAQELLAAQRLRVVGRAARAAGIHTTLLKSDALRAAGLLAAGSRTAVDLDLLVPAAEAERFQEALGEQGFADVGASGYDHQLPAVVHPRLGAVEVHLHLPGVIPPGGRGPATHRDLSQRGRLLPVGNPADGLSAPAREILAAHALAHGLAQHGWAPEAYPALRTLADLADLGLGGATGEEAGAEDGKTLGAAAAAWLVGTLEPSEVEAARALVARLVAGETAVEGDGALLLDHLLAGALDAEYRRALKLRWVRPPIPAGGHAEGVGGLWRVLRRALVLSRGEIDAIYGPPKGALGYLARRVARPFDLAGRLVRAAWSWLRLRRRRR